ncbi:hypothetical protein [Nostoc sp.]|uniref:hypothetical protein n=1 Tax=Nostoc sp. TaxID=1180 RepID=UPI002FFCF86C
MAIFVLAVAVTFYGGRYAIADEPPPSASIICAETSTLEKNLRGKLGNKLLTYAAILIMRMVINTFSVKLTDGT